MTEAEVLQDLGIIALTLAAGGWLYRNSLASRRKALLNAPFPLEWEEILQRNVTHYKVLEPGLQAQVREHVKIFVAEKNFEGCGGQVINDEVRVTIAGLASLLLLNRSTSLYRRLQTVLVYPAAYRDSAEGQVRLGESWGDGTVVLSWCDVTGSARNARDGHNLVLHEFAHQLDQEDGSSDGVPVLESRARYVHWAQLLQSEYQRLVELTRKHKKDVIGAYGATNPAEFFAVATEVFFEKPFLLQKKHPELYSELRDFYHLDPVSWPRD